MIGKARIWYEGNHQAMKLHLIALSLLLACDPGPPEVPANVSACEGACIVFDHFGCEVESEKGNLKLCQEKCERVAMVGYVWADDSSGPGCVVKVKTMEQLKACNVRCNKVSQ